MGRAVAELHIGKWTASHADAGRLDEIGVGVCAVHTCWDVEDGRGQGAGEGGGNKEWILSEFGRQISDINLRVGCLADVRCCFSLWTAFFTRDGPAAGTMGVAVRTSGNRRPPSRREKKEIDPGYVHPPQPQPPANSDAGGYAASQFLCSKESIHSIVRPTLAFLPTTTMLACACPTPSP